MGKYIEKVKKREGLRGDENIGITWGTENPTIETIEEGDVTLEQGDILKYNKKEEVVEIIGNVYDEVSRIEE